MNENLDLTKDLTYSEEEKIKISKFESFVSAHRGEIRGLYDDSFYKNGGLNGKIDSLNEVIKRYGFEYEELPEGEWEEIIELI
jgi:hypothetical protein